MDTSHPKRYLHPFIDSTHWERFEPRPDDIIVATPFKSGTTWVQMIVLSLIHGIENPPLLRDVGHWIDFRSAPQDELYERLYNQRSRRFIKTHLPFDAIPFYGNVKYIVVDRDPRDVFMSLWNHYQNMNLDLVNGNLPAEIEAIPPCPDNIHEFWKVWLTRGYFDWESEGYPFWSNLRHAQSWFDARCFKNVLHVHYGNLLKGSPAEIRKIANFIRADINETQAKAIAEYTSFTNTKQNLSKLFPGGYRLFKDGPDTFFHKGTNGRWRGVLTEDDLKLFDNVTSSILSKECLNWLTSGTMSDRIPRSKN